MAMIFDTDIERHKLLFAHYHLPVHALVKLLCPKTAHCYLNGVIRYAPRPGRGSMDFSNERWRSPLRLHPISLALRFLKGQRTLRGAPYYGAPLFLNAEEAVSVLRRLTGRDFGMCAAAWGAWLSRNRWVYYASPNDPKFTAPDCPRCRGSGRVCQRSRKRDRRVVTRMKCPACGGRGIGCVAVTRDNSVLK